MKKCNLSELSYDTLEGLYRRCSSLGYLTVDGIPTTFYRRLAALPLMSATNAGQALHTKFVWENYRYFAGPQTEWNPHAFISPSGMSR